MELPGIDDRLIRNDNIVDFLERATANAKRVCEIKKQISSMDNFWSVPLRHIVDGKETVEPVKLTSVGHPAEYTSIKPIRLVFDGPFVYKDPFDTAKMKQVFHKYCEVAKSNGYDLPEFASRFDKLRFHVKTFVKRIAEKL